ncbi:hypothetical protein ABK040_013683 [Willaertia magna]
MIVNNQIVTYNSPYKQKHSTIDLIQLYLKYKEEMNEFAKIKPNCWSIKSINSTTISSTTTTTTTSDTATKEFNNYCNQNIGNIKNNHFNTTSLVKELEEPLDTTMNWLQKKKRKHAQHNDVHFNTSLIIINTTPLEIKKEIENKVTKENSKFKKKRGRPKKKTTF